MSPNHTRHVSEESARPAQPGRGTPTSSTRQFTHCSQISIHGYYRRRYRTGESSSAEGAGNIVFTSGRIPRPGQARTEVLPDQAFFSARIVRYGNKQNILAIINPEGSIRNTFTFNTGTTCRQWRGRSRCGPHCEVSRG